jgi:hypothetical protein
MEINTGMLNWVVGFTLFPFEHTFMYHKKWFLAERRRKGTISAILEWSTGWINLCSKGNKQTLHLTISVGPLTSEGESFWILLMSENRLENGSKSEISHEWSNEGFICSLLSTLLNH